MLMWLKKGLDGRGGMAGVFGALDAVFNPGAARAREEMDDQHERVIPTPSPGDRMLGDGRVRIRVQQSRPPEEDSRRGSGSDSGA